MACIVYFSDFLPLDYAIPAIFIIDPLSLFLSPSIFWRRLLTRSLYELLFDAPLSRKWGCLSLLFPVFPAWLYRPTWSKTTIVKYNKLCLWITLQINNLFFLRYLCNTFHKWLHLRLWIPFSKLILSCIVSGNDSFSKIIVHLSTFSSSLLHHSYLSTKEINSFKFHLIWPTLSLFSKVFNILNNIWCYNICEAIVWFSSVGREDEQTQIMIFHISILKLYLFL